MRWTSFAASVVLLTIAFVAFPTPPPPLGLAVLILGSLLLLDCSWDSSIGFASWGGLETRSEEITTEFYRMERARWRYLLAVVMAAVTATVAAKNASEEVQMAVLIGSIALFALYGLTDILRCRKRVSQGRAGR